MEKNEISIHELRVFKALKDAAPQWLSNKEIEAIVGPIHNRTVRSHTLKLVRSGLVDQAEVFPGHRYKYSDKASKRNSGYLLRLTKAAEVFGLAL